MQCICNMSFNLINQKPQLIHVSLETRLQGRVVFPPTPRFEFCFALPEKRGTGCDLQVLDSALHISLREASRKKKAQKIYSLYHCDAHNLH